MLDVFTPDAFTRVELAKFVKKIPTPYQLLDSLGLFPERGVTTKTVAVEDLIETRGLLPSLPVGAPPTENSSDKRSLISVATFHFALHDAIRPQDVQNVRAEGQEDAILSLGAATMAKQQKMIGRLYETLEWLRMGALQGSIKDGDGSTELLNLFTLFGATQRTTDFALNNSSTDVIGKCLDELDYIEANLKGAIMTGMPLALCSPTFFKALVTHTLVKAAFQYYQVNGQNLASDYRGGFTFGGIVWRSYAGSFTNTAGTSSPLIAEDTAYLAPQGAGIGQTILSPADFTDTVNTPGVLVNFKQERMKYDKGWDLLLESNPLPICYRPELVVKLTTP